MMDNNAPRLDADAVSLHTIAERDIYASQEHEDADFALALSLEEEEEDHARNVARNIAQTEEREALIARESEEQQSRLRDGPYRDDPDDQNSAAAQTDNVAPYRDDPEAVAEDAADGSDAPTKNEPMRRYLGLCASRIQNASRRLALWTPTLLKHTLRAVAIALIILAIWLGVAIIPALRKKEVPPPTPKQRAFEVSGSTNGNLLLQRLYPQLEDDASRYCKDAWEELKGLPCHEAILSSAWDKGDDRHIRDMKMDVWAYSKLVCDDTRTCERAIRGLKDKISKVCIRRRNRFDLIDYGMRAYHYFDNEEIDDGPAQAVHSLEARYIRLCDRPTSELWGAPIEWGTYAAELWMQWGIADGKDADMNLRDVRTFIDATSEKKTIKGHIRRGSVETEHGKVPYEVEVLTRKVGPGEGESDCGYSIRSWLERKWRSFEHGAIANPRTDNQMGLAAFNELMETAVKRCEKFEAEQMIRRRHTMWEQYGWWCNGAPCHSDEPAPDIVLQLLHGLNLYDYPVNAIRAHMDKPDAPREVLQAFHDSLLSMPCSIWLKEEEIMEHIAPFDYRVRQLCSNECRNSVDRIQHQIGERFEEVLHNHWGSLWHYHWYNKRWLMNATCLGPDYDDIISEITPFCAPGYAALGHPEWILPMPEGTPSKKEILAAFAPAVDALAASLPDYIPRPSSDAETQRRLARQVSESVCNRCASELMIGKKPNGDKRIQVFLHDDEVDHAEYRRVVRLYLLSCAKITVGTESAKHMDEQWMRLHLEKA
jgi:hypothetical protein